MPPPKISPALLDKYLRNQCTDEEKELVEAWYASLQGKPDYLDSLSETEQGELQSETFQTIQDQLHIGQQSGTRPLPVRRLLWLAASVSLIMGLYITYRYTSRQDISPTAVSYVAPTRKNVAERAIEFTNREPRPVRHLLPDSSSVWMQAGASIAYPKKFDSNKRVVSFSGEGFFQVRKDPLRPFHIQSGVMRVKVLGTSFNVKAPVSHKVFQISVVTGRVEVSAPDRQQKPQQVILKPQQQAFFETESGRLLSSPVPVQVKKEIYESVSVVFNNTPLDRAIAQLEKRFNIQIRLANPGLSSCRVSADFEQQSLPLIMEMLCTALDATYTMSGNTIVIDGLPCE
ncbi:FecR domain-containing protein [Nibrella saemangeumensis]|uniref:FecR domain-containing protein n=1 Tax=Nibrella saemangeumensis TaxID=1084526 RepID=A0ABP8NPB1_9BACT